MKFKFSASLSRFGMPTSINSSLALSLVEFYLLKFSLRRQRLSLILKATYRAIFRRFSHLV